MYIDENGKKWYKGNIHLHTSESDGNKTPEEAFELYRDNGYDFVARTDHRKMSENGEYNGMLIVGGAEYDTGLDVRNGVYHILSLFADKDVGYEKSKSAQDYIDGIHAAGGIAVLAHPAWSLESPEMVAALHGVDMTEIFNSVSDRPFNCRPYSGDILDIAATKGCILKLAASDDAHFYGKSDCVRSYIMVEAEELTHDALKKAILKGRYYASQGPHISVRLEEGKILVDCSPVEEVVFYNDLAWDPNRCTVGKGITHCKYIPDEHTTFLRVEAKDAEGRCAWSQYITLK